MHSISHNLCLHFYFLVVSFRVWYHYVPTYVKFSFVCVLHFNSCAHIVKQNWLHTLDIYLYSEIFPFFVIFDFFSQNVKRESVYSFCQPTGYVLAQLFLFFFMWNNDLVFHIALAICNSLVSIYRIQIEQSLTFICDTYTLFNYSKFLHLKSHCNWINILIMVINVE